jgi:hypothetical protein
MLPPAHRRRGFDLTVNLGHVIIIAITVAGVVGTYYVNNWRLDALEQRAARIEAKLDGFANTVIQSAVTAQRLQDYDQRLAAVERRR